MDSTKKDHSVSAFGIIGSTVGWSSMQITPNLEYEKFLSNAAEQILPYKRTLMQLEEYLIEKYQAIPHTLSTHELSILKANVIMNHFDEVIEKPAPLVENPTEDDIKAYLKYNTSFFQAREYPAEKLGLEMKAYKLPYIQSEIKPRSDQKVKRQLAIRHSSYCDDEVIVEMEMKSGYLSILNGGEDIMNDLIMYLGVSEEDIIERSPCFIGYAYALKHMGKL